jgi:hypothetical protein
MKIFGKKNIIKTQVDTSIMDKLERISAYKKVSIEALVRYYIMRGLNDKDDILKFSLDE